MKTIKNFLLVICFLSAISLSAYAAGSVGCSCQAYLQSQGAITQSGLIWISPGITVHWQLHVLLNNEEPSNTASAQGEFELAIQRNLYRTFTGYTHGLMEYWDSGTYTNNSGSDAPIIYLCYAQIVGPDQGGGALGQALLQW